eukprot:m.274245 g.274245  ORF g.274245 m.274245 type:complete len:125 (-) comp54828_c0_seq17:578-952(-)
MCCTRSSADPQTSNGPPLSLFLSFLSFPFLSFSLLSFALFLPYLSFSSRFLPFAWSFLCLFLSFDLLSFGRSSLLVLSSFSQSSIPLLILPLSWSFLLLVIVSPALHSFPLHEIYKCVFLSACG